MPLLPLADWSLPAIALAFAAAAGVILWAGHRLAVNVDALAAKTHLRTAFLGMVLLGLATSLPEVATVATAASLGNAPLAVNNLLGGIAFQVALLAVADVAMGRRGLTAAVRAPLVLLQGVLLILMLSVIVLAIHLEGPPFWFGVGPWALGVAVLYVLSVLVSQRTTIRWRSPRETDDAGRGRGDGEEGGDGGGGGDVEQQGEGEAAGEEEEDVTTPAQRAARERSVPILALRFGGLGLVVLVAGTVAAEAADQIAHRTGLDAGFVGVALLAAATSLPELITTVAAARLGAPGLAVANIFGTNLADGGLLLVADAFYGGGPVLAEVGAFSAGAAALGIALTAIYLAGLLRRSDARPQWVGPDSLAAVVVYVGGLMLLLRMT